MKQAVDQYQSYRREFDAALPALVAPFVLLLALGAASLTWPRPAAQALCGIDAAPSSP